jgi:TRAP-type C4-dicarboxylate transport system permease small subunit
VVYGLFFTRIPGHRWLEYTRISTGETQVNAVKLFAIVLIVAGTLGLVYGGFTYTKDTQKAQLGSLELSVTDTETVNVPIWAGVGAIVAGGILLLVRK